MSAEALVLGAVRVDGVAKCLGQREELTERAPPLLEPDDDVDQLVEEGVVRLWGRHATAYRSAVQRCGFERRRGPRPPATAG